MYKTYIYTHACRHKLVLHFNPSTLCDHWFIRWIIWGFSVLFSQPQKAPLKTSLQFPNGLTSCLRKKGRGKREGEREKLREKQKEKQRWSFKMIAMFPKGLASVQGEFFREQTVKCVLSNEATVKLSQSLFSALLVRSENTCFLSIIFPSLLTVYLSSPFSFSSLTTYVIFLPVFPQVSNILTVKYDVCWKLEWQLSLQLSDLAHNPLRTIGSLASLEKHREHRFVEKTLLTLRWFVLLCC